MATELGKAYVQIIPTAQGISGAITNALGGEATAAGMTSGSNFAAAMGKGISTAGMVTAAAATAAAAAIAGVSKEAIASYATYEQLEGGVKKLYGNMGLSVEEYAALNKKSVSEVQDEWQQLDKAQQLVLQNAQNAYKTSGMSANQYMETATSFSASLIKSLGGDTVKAAELTDTAMKAISDNFNTFGGDIGMIQGAFQGFAKQNYTMLDNLKLGYGGTKTEMEKLIADANEYAASMGQASNLSIDSFADIVQAIQLIQEKQQIAGTTLRESMTTIEGSANATKAAWENVITAIGRGEGINEAFNGLMSSLFGENEGEGLLNQIIPRLQTVFDGIGNFIATAAPIFSEKIPVLIESVLPAVLESASALIISLSEGLLNALPFIVNSATQIGLEFINTIMGLLPEVATLAMQLVANLATSIGEAAPELIPDAVNTIIDTILSILENVDALVEGAVALVTGLTDGIMNALPILIERLPEIIIKIIEALILAAPQLVSVGPQLILSLIAGIIQSIPKLLTMGPRLVGELVKALINDAPKMIESGIAQVDKLIEGITQMIPQLLTLPGRIVNDMVSAFSSVAHLLFGVGELIGNTIHEAISKVAKQAIEWGKDLMKSFADGIGEGIEFVKDALEAVADAIAALIHFSEPDEGPLKNFHTFAPDMMDLFTKGIKDNTEELREQVKKSFDLKDLITGSFDASPNVYLVDSDTQGGFVQNLTVNAPQELDPSEIARLTRNANREMMLQLRTT